MNQKLLTFSNSSAGKGTILMSFTTSDWNKEKPNSSMSSGSAREKKCNYETEHKILSQKKKFLFINLI